MLRWRFSRPGKSLKFLHFLTFLPEYGSAGFFFCSFLRRIAYIYKCGAALVVDLPVFIKQGYSYENK